MGLERPSPLPFSSKTYTQRSLPAVPTDCDNVAHTMARQWYLLGLNILPTELVSADCHERFGRDVRKTTLFIHPEGTHPLASLTTSAMVSRWSDTP